MSLSTIDQQAGPSLSLADLRTQIASNGVLRQNLIDFMVAAKSANQRVSEGKTSYSWRWNSASGVSQKDPTYASITYETLNKLFCFSSALNITNPTGITNAARLAIQYQNSVNKRNDSRSRGQSCLPPLAW